MPMSIEVVPYSGPAGNGYQATVRVRVLGTLYERTAQVGAETHRVDPWHVVDED